MTGAPGRDRDSLANLQDCPERRGRHRGLGIVDPEAGAGFVPSTNTSGPKPSGGPVGGVEAPSVTWLLEAGVVGDNNRDHTGNAGWASGNTRVDGRP